MAINNRSLHGSLQREVAPCQLGAVATAESHVVHLAPRPQIVEAIKVSSLGLSGAPTANFQIVRFITGSGSTTIGAFCTTLTLAALGTSGTQSVVFLASMPLVANDAIQFTSGASNAAVTELRVDVLVKNLEDIRTQFGTSY